MNNNTQILNDVNEQSVKSGLLNLITNIIPSVNKLRQRLLCIYDNPKNDRDAALKKRIETMINEFKCSVLSSSTSITNDLKETFIDSYVQILIHGIFMGWIRQSKKTEHAKEKFGFDTVISYLPKNSLVWNLFSEMRKVMLSDTKLNEIFGSIFTQFNNSEFRYIPQSTVDLTNEFYSDFLELYDKETRKKLGVVYTPDAIVDFMIRGIDYFLTHELGFDDGVLNENVTFWDPSAGTMAFPCSLMKLVREKIRLKSDQKTHRFGDSFFNQNETFSKYFNEMFVQKNARVCGFEILMVPYILGSLRILMLGESLGANVNYENDKPQTYLVNTLMDVPKERTLFSIINDMNNNSDFYNNLNEALKIRNNKNFTVIFTNPPYSISSQNNGEWIENLVADYYRHENLTREAGKPSIKPITAFNGLKDDYVKFIRLAQWKVEENTEDTGNIVCLITNNFYIDGLVTRGLRKELMKTFDKIYIVNLHGDWRKKTPERAKGKENGFVFNVNCGIAIMFAIRLPKEKHKTNKKNGDLNCEIYYAEVWGTVEEKLNALKNRTINDMDFIRVQDNLDFEFTPYIVRDDQYQTFPYLVDIFEQHHMGIISGHDREIMGYDINETKDKLKRLYTKYPKEMLENRAFKSKNKWNPQRLLNVGMKTLSENIYEHNWRGFDKRYVIYYRELMTTASWNTVQYLLPHQNNLVILANKQSRWKATDLGSSVFISNTFVSHCCLESPSGFHSYMFPLKINKETNSGDEPKPAVHSNITTDFIQSLPYWAKENTDEITLLKFGTEIFYYIYGVLFSPTYRENYKELLTVDFPRVPFPSNYLLFQKMSELGKKIADYHLLIDEDVINTENNNKRKTNLKDFDSEEFKIRNYNYANNKIRFKIVDGKENDPSELIIENVSQEVWDFVIGGIPQLNNWLKERRYSSNKNERKRIKRGLTRNEINYFLKIINAIELTLKTLPELDAMYNRIMSNLFNF
jgi:predicted helicase